MAYAFDVDETVPQAVHRITNEQVERAVSALEQASGNDLEAAVHDCRKRAKKLRGVIRLVRPALGKDFRPANESFREAGRELSGLRGVRAGLAALAESATQADDRQLRTERAVDLLRAGRQHVTHAKLDAKGWAAVGPGVERPYRAGRRALAEVRRHTDPTAVHEWRKRAKDGWYHVRLLRDTAPSVLEPLEDRFHHLSDALGDAHDLVVITDRVQASPDDFGGKAQVRAFCELADTRRAKLERRAMGLGVRLYAEKPARYAERMAAYWDLWHETGGEKPAGGLADLFPP